MTFVMFLLATYILRHRFTFQSVIMLQICYRTWSLMIT